MAAGRKEMGKRTRDRPFMLRSEQVDRFSDGGWQTATGVGVFFRERIRISNVSGQACS